MSDGLSDECFYYFRGDMNMREKIASFLHCHQFPVIWRGTLPGFSIEDSGRDNFIASLELIWKYKPFGWRAQSDYFIFYNITTKSEIASAKLYSNTEVDMIWKAIVDYKELWKKDLDDQMRIKDGEQYVILQPTISPRVYVFNIDEYWDGTGHEIPLELGTSLFRTKIDFLRFLKLK